MNNFDAWFAGFFDGEGTISKLANSSIALEVAQGLNPKRPVRHLFRKIQKQYGGHVDITRTRKQGLHRIRWRVLKREEVINIISRILPYVELRKDDLQEVLIFYKKCKTQKHYLTDKEKKLLFSKLSQQEISKRLGISQQLISLMKIQGRDYYCTGYHKN